jgi:HIRAN domain-containing protein
MLEREPSNQYDPNAIAVWNAARTLQAGYIPRDDAARLAKKLDKGEHFRVLAIWETFEADRRTGIRLLLLGEEARCGGP